MSQGLLSRKIDESIKSSGFSKGKIAQEIGVTRPTLDSYIKGSSVIGTDKLIRLASCTGRGLDYFLSDGDQPKVFFRATNIDEHSKKYHIQAEEKLRQYSYLENLVESANSYMSLEMPLIEYDEQEIRNIATTTRLTLGLSSENIVSDIFEVVGQFAKIIRLEFDEEAVSGFSAHSDVWGGAIFLNSKTTTERQVFTTVHEMAHLIMHREFYKKDISEKEYKVIERMANYFAGVFLIPFEALKKAYDELGEVFSWEEFLKLKLKFRVSALALLYRLYQENFIGKNSYVQTMQNLKRVYKFIEPKPCLKDEDFYSLANDRFKILLKKGYSKKQLSPSKLAELAGVSQKQIREWIHSWLAEKDLASGASEK